MRYIDTSSINVPNNWVDLAKEQLGNTYPSLWSYFREDFEKIVGAKCWYSESVNIGSANPIDHFRPKSQILKQLPLYDQIKTIIHKINIEADSGYPFLKYEFINYRYACHIVNSPNKKGTQDSLVRGKWDFFPIAINTNRITSVNDLINEEYCLLDPCNEEDPKLLTFNHLGLIQPNISVSQNSWEYCKVLISIEVYHLHYYKFNEARLIIWNKYADIIRRANIFYARNPKNQEDREILSGFIKDIFKGIKKKEPFSGVVIDCIQFNKKQYSWLKQFFPDKLLEK